MEKYPSTHGVKPRQGGEIGMKTVAQKLASYGAYHRNRWNKLTHAFGVPLVVFAVLLALSWLRLPLGTEGFSVAPFFAAAVWAHYVMLELGLAVAMLPFIVPLIYAAEMVAVRADAQVNAVVFAVVLILGLALQLLGHAIEGRRPVLAYDIRQLLVAPIFLLAELGFRLGLWLPLKQEVDRLSGE
jgi:uncharacterized membrane protein YGL010W